VWTVHEKTLFFSWLQLQTQSNMAIRMMYR